MQGLFNCTAMGKSTEPSKSGKYHYLFIAGERGKDGLFTSFSPVDFWTDENFKIEVYKQYRMVLDINGEYIRFVKFDT